jgi:hypothetical protein
MNAEGADRLADDADARRSELERAFLSVQRERMALTETYVPFAVECGPGGIETLILRLLRLQRTVGMANHQLSAHGMGNSSWAGYVP